MAAALLRVASPGELIAGLLLGLVWLFWALCAGYLLLLCVAAALRRRPGIRVQAPGGEERRFCIVIPAHNEELLLGTVLDRLGELDYPAELRTTVVVADNCTDRTASVARLHGAEAAEREDALLRGKGYALDWALARLLQDPRRFDAFLILDADSVLSPNFLREMNALLARGDCAVQGYYGVLNVDESWRTRLMAVALALAHYVKPLGRSALGLSDGLKGNGMCFHREVLEQIPWSGESITEDIDYTLRLAEAGVRIEFAPNAVVSAQMPTTGAQASTQRQRWEGGRYGLLRRAFGTFFRAVLRGKWLLADRAAELIVPPFVEMFALPVLMLLGCTVWRAIVPGSVIASGMQLGWSLVLAAELLYLAVGLMVARVPVKTASALLFAPFYIVWKLGLYGVMLLRRGGGGWHRTERRTIT